MRTNLNGRGRWIARVGVGLTGILMAFGAVGVWAQDAAVPVVVAGASNSAKAGRPFPCMDATNPATGSIKMFHFNNVSQPNDGNEIQTAIRNLLPPDSKIYYVPSQATLYVCASPEQLAAAQKVIAELDQPKRSYRLTYTISEMDGGKKVSTAHFVLMPADGQRVSLKQGSKVPVVTGSYNASSNPAGAQTQFQYLDVGMNFDATVTGVAGGALLKTKVEQSSVAEEKSGVDAREPIIRQTSLEGSSLLVLGKPLLLGSVDISGSTRHLDIEAMIEVVK